MRGRRCFRVWTALRALPPGLFGMALLVAVVELTVAGHSLGLLHAQGLGIRFAALAARDEGPRSAVLALGDSTIKCGFDPIPAMSALGPGRPVYNLAVAGTPMPVTWSVYRRAVAAGARPAALVVGCENFMGEPRGRAVDLAEAFTAAEALGFARDCRDPWLAAALLTRRVLPSLRYRDGLRAALADLWDPPAGSGPRPFPGKAAAVWCLGAWAGRRGADPHLFDGHYQGRLAPHVEQQMRTEVWRVNPVYLAYARRIAALAARDGVPVFWVVPPMAPEAQEWRDRTGLDARHTYNLRAGLGSLANVVVIDARHAGYPADHFSDAIHLNARGAARFSTELATALRRHLDGRPLPRWASLPAAADGPSALATRPGTDLRR